MIKLTFCLHRLESLSRDEFQLYWRAQHAQLVAQHSEVLRIRRYVQLHTSTTPFDAGLREGRGAPEPFDGIAELWWDSLDVLSAVLQAPEGQKAGAELLEDERRFIDLARSPIFLGEEHVVLGG